jgi:uncharacterized protein
MSDEERRTSDEIARAKALLGSGDEQGMKAAFSIFTIEAQSGDSEAEYFLGLMFARGQGVKQSYTAASGWFSRSAEKGNLDSMYFLGKMYRDGFGVAQDPSKAEELLLLPATSGDPRAQYALGTLFFSQNARAADAYRWMLASAEQGYVEAQFVLGQFHLKGYGIPQDTEEGLRWLRFAALAGHDGAQLLLGNIYLHGENGVEANAIESDRWFDMAGKRKRPT